MTSISFNINFIQIIFQLNYFLGSPKGCDTLKNKKGIRVEGCGRKTTTAAPFKQKWPKIKRPNIPRVHQTEDDNNTDSKLTTTVTPDGNIAQQDSVVVTLSIGKILYMNKIKMKVKIFLFFLFFFPVYLI